MIIQASIIHKMLSLFRTVSIWLRYSSFIPYLACRWSEQRPVKSGNRGGYTCTRPVSHLTWLQLAGSLAL